MAVHLFQSGRVQRPKATTKPRLTIDLLLSNFYCSFIKNHQVMTPSTYSYPEKCHPEPLLISYITINQLSCNSLLSCIFGPLPPVPSNVSVTALVLQSQAKFLKQRLYQKHAVTMCKEEILVYQWSRTTNRNHLLLPVCSENHNNEMQFSL